MIHSLICLLKARHQFRQVHLDPKHSELLSAVSNFNCCDKQLFLGQPFTHCGNLGELLKFCISQFSHLLNTYLVVSF